MMRASINIAPDRAEAERFLQLLDPEASFFTFQTFDDDKERKDERLARIFHGTLDEHFDTLADLNAKGAGIFITVNATDGAGRTIKNVTRVRALFADLDHAPVEPVLASRPAPHAVVETSPGRHQAHWLIAGIELKEFSNLQKVLAARFGGDASVHDLPRVMRLPGFSHRKGAPFLVRIVKVNDAAPCAAFDFISAASAGADELERLMVKHAGLGIAPDEPSRWKELNDAALANLDAWVPDLFGDAARHQSSSGGYRVSSKDLNRDLEEDLSLHPDGIKDFGVHDMGDEREGRRSPIDVVMEHGGKDFAQAADWLRAKLGYDSTGAEELKTGQKQQGDRSDEAQRPTSRIVMICAADVVMRPKSWIWEGHLLRGGLELMTGQPGLGKSQVQCHIVACASAGLKWPNGAKIIAPVNVIMVTAEDALDTEVVPRLIAAGANLERVHILKSIRTDNRQRQFLLAEDLVELEHEVARIGEVGLITIDPITAYMGGKMDSHKATEVRSQLGPLKDFAERSNTAVSAITHPAKNASKRAIDHFIGSQAFIAAARIGHVCTEEIEYNDNGESEPTGRTLFTNPKNNPHVKMPTLAYRFGETIVGQDLQTGETIAAPRVIWDQEAVNISADEALAAASQTRKPRDDTQSKVQDFLRDMLSDGSSVEETIIRDHGEQRGFTIKQLRTAKEKLGIRSEKTGFSGGWKWFLPPLT
jgi:hypothetical protein